MTAQNPIDEDQYRKEVLLHPSDKSEISSNQKLLDEAHQLGLKVPEIEVIASLTASIASGMLDLPSSSPVVSSGSSTGRNSVCERPATPRQHQRQHRPQKQHAHQYLEIPLDQIASSLSELTVSSRPVKSGSVRSIASLSTRPTSYCSSDGKLAAGNDGVATKPAMHHSNRHSMISMTPREKKEKRRASLRTAIDKFPFRRKRTSSAVFLPPETQITVTKGERGEEKVYVEPKPDESHVQAQAQPTSVPNNEDNSAMKLEIPVFDYESLQRSLVSAELVKMREAHQLERNRHVAFQSASMTRLRSRQQASVADRLADNKRLEEEKREKNAANAIRMEERQLAVEIEQQREFDREKQNARTRIKHMEGYFSNRSPPSPGSGSEKLPQPRKYTSQQKAQLAQEYHDHKTMDQLHEAKIKVLRERQERRLQEATERMEKELDALIDRHAEGFSELQKQHQEEESIVVQGFDARKAKLMHRWNLEEAVLRRKLEQQHGQPYGPLPPLTFNDSHYETRDSACCVAGSSEEEQVRQKGEGTMF